MRETLGNKFITAADLPGETLPGIPLVEIAGNNRALVENHKGVIQYGSECIRLKVKFGQICICGQELKLSQMTKGQMIISGQIDSVHMIRGC